MAYLWLYDKKIFLGPQDFLQESECDMEMRFQAWFVGMCRSICLEALLDSAVPHNQFVAGRLDKQSHAQSENLEKKMQWEHFARRCLRKTPWKICASLKNPPWSLDPRRVRRTSGWTADCSLSSWPSWLTCYPFFSTEKTSNTFALNWRGKHKGTMIYT